MAGLRRGKNRSHYEPTRRSPQARSLVLSRPCALTAQRRGNERQTALPFIQFLLKAENCRCERSEQAIGEPAAGAGERLRGGCIMTSALGKFL